MISLEFQKLDVLKIKAKENKELLGYEVFETDNIWTETPAAVEAHWGLTKTYDYSLDRHQRKGMDGNNGHLQCFVNFSSNHTNAFYLLSTISSVLGYLGSLPQLYGCNGKCNYIFAKYESK